MLYANLNRFVSSAAFATRCEESKSNQYIPVVLYHTLVETLSSQIESGIVQYQWLMQ